MTPVLARGSSPFRSRAWPLAALTLVLLTAIAAEFASAAPRTNYSGPFSRPDGLVRCALYHDGAACVAMPTGRVAAVYSDGTTETYRTTDPIRRGPAFRNRWLINRGSTIACRVGPRFVMCSTGGEVDSGFLIDTQALLSTEFGLEQFYDDAPRRPVVPAGYVPPYRYTPPNVIPDYRDPGGTYGSISPVTGLPRTYFVRGYVTRSGTYVGPYYRSCSRCR
jgi:hypothetical protein